MTTRCSRLDDAEACGLSASLAEREPRTTNVYAMRGNAFHAGNASHYRPDEERFADARATAFGVLSIDDGADVTHMLQELWRSGWAPPADAKFEVPMGLDRDGLAVPYDSDKCITRGTADLVYVDGEHVVVIDFKSGARAEWNVPPPAENLQLLAYGFGFADLLGKTKVKLGIYRGASEVEGERWLWAEIDLDTPEATKAWERVRGAALHDPKEAVTGPHCGECWARLRCPAFLMPAVSEVDQQSAFALMSTPVDQPIEPAKLLRLLNAVAALEDLAKAGKDFAKAYVAQHGGVEIDGKVWDAVPVKPRELISIKSLKESGLYERARAVGAVTDGQPTVQHRWVNAKKGERAA